MPKGAPFVGPLASPVGRAAPTGVIRHRKVARSASGSSPEGPGYVCDAADVAAGEGWFKTSRATRGGRCAR